MIHSTPSPDRTPRPEAVSSSAPFVAPPRGPGADRFSPEHTTALRAALGRHPEVRPDVVERGRALAADPSWPSPEILHRVGELILSAPDLAADES
ncbi:MAG TPA: hypothetical protein VEB66_11805 [Opitutaceae bacterium]|nr:hypothetical protein [Opitutaceae bacterium]